MTLTYYELELDILLLDLPAKIQVCMFVRSARRVRQTDTHTQRRCKNYYTHHVRDVGCKKKGKYINVQN